MLKNRELRIDFVATKNVGVNVGVKNDILNNLKDNPNLTVQELATMLNKTTRTIERNIRELREKGIVSRIGSDKTGSWIINQLLAK
jgi:ATP-dependent DNA helicase RecG